MESEDTSTPTTGAGSTGQVDPAQDHPAEKRVRAAINELRLARTQGGRRAQLLFLAKEDWESLNPAGKGRIAASLDFAAVPRSGFTAVAGRAMCRSVRTAQRDLERWGGLIDEARKAWLAGEIDGRNASELCTCNPAIQHSLLRFFLESR